VDAASIRRAYAEGLRSSASLQVESVVDAFATIPREIFRGPGPWQIAQPLDTEHPYRTTPDARLEHIYADVLVAIDPARQLNNGQPSAHARWIEAAAPQAGESVLHVGCGTGYYTAILAEMVGPAGRVVAYEVDAALAARAHACLRGWPQVQVIHGDAGEPRGLHDVVYVNAGATHARAEWLAAVSPGARLLLPLTAHVPLPWAPTPASDHGFGFVIRAERSDGIWPVRVVSPVGIFDCVGARDEAAELQLRKLLDPEAAKRIRVLSVEPHSKGKGCLLHIDGFCLQE
jgi:protein-L-isoaspartate(D-aspartate) O-methyltransferase